MSTAKAVVQFPQFGPFQSSNRPQIRHGNDWFRSTAGIGRRPLERVGFPKQSPMLTRRWPASDAACASAARATQLELHLASQIRIQPAQLGLVFFCSGLVCLPVTPTDHGVVSGTPNNVVQHALPPRLGLESIAQGPTAGMQRRVSRTLC
jgi:hypothetical protein